MDFYNSVVVHSHSARHRHEVPPQTGNYNIFSSHTIIFSSEHLLHQSQWAQHWGRLILTPKNGRCEPLLFNGLPACLPPSLPVRKHVAVWVPWTFLFVQKQLSFQTKVLFWCHMEDRGITKQLRGHWLYLGVQTPAPMGVVLQTPVTQALGE